MIDVKDFEKALHELFDENNDYIVKEAMNYSLYAKSKRLRPLLLLNMLTDLNVDYHIGLKAAVALEMVHTYSLIHDDLPAFDNDDYRRGQLTCHKKFDEATAILAGDGLLTDAFKLIVQSDLPASIKCKLIEVLSTYAGSDGMIKGQSFDMLYEDENPTNVKQLEQMISLKTGRLLTAPFMMALIIADKEELKEKFADIGYQLGLSFQLQDDLLDVTSTLEQMGKSLSDEANNKKTFITFLGTNKVEQIVSQTYENIFNNLQDFPNTTALLKTMVNRNW